MSLHVLAHYRHIAQFTIIDANGEEVADAWTGLEFEAAFSEMPLQFINKATCALYPVYRQEVDARGNHGGDVDDRGVGLGGCFLGGGGGCLPPFLSCEAVPFIISGSLHIARSRRPGR